MTATGTQLTGKSGLVGYFDAPPDKPTVFEFVRYMEPRTTIIDAPLRLARIRARCTRSGPRNGTGPGWRSSGSRSKARSTDTWPPASHRRLFGDLAQKTSSDNNYGDRVEVVSEQPLVDAERILATFARRAFRRTVTDDDVKPFRGASSRPSWRTDTRSSRRCGSALKGVLISPRLPVPAREAGQARRLRPGQPAVVLPLEHDARRRAVHARRTEEVEPAGRPAPAGRAHAQASPRRRPSPRTSSASGSACATSTPRSPATSSTRNSTTC